LTGSLHANTLQIFMVEIEALLARERLKVVYRGRVLTTELQQAERQLLTVLPRMGPSFDMVCDVSAAEPLTQEAMDAVRRLAGLLLPAGMRTHVRVVGRSGPTALQFQRIGRSVGYDSRLAFSLAEAEGLLDGPA
jgi:hypothetical protein